MTASTVLASVRAADAEIGVTLKSIDTLHQHITLLKRTFALPGTLRKELARLRVTLAELRLLSSILGKIGPAKVIAVGLRSVLRAFDRAITRINAALTRVDTRIVKVKAALKAIALQVGKLKALVAQVKKASARVESAVAHHGPHIASLPANARSHVESLCRALDGATARLRAVNGLIGAGLGTIAGAMADLGKAVKTCESAVKTLKTINSPTQRLIGALRFIVAAYDKLGPMKKVIAAVEGVIDYVLKKTKILALLKIVGDLIAEVLDPFLAAVQDFSQPFGLVAMGLGEVQRELGKVPAQLEGMRAKLQELFDVCVPPELRGKIAAAEVEARADARELSQALHRFEKELVQARLVMDRGRIEQVVAAHRRELGKLVDNAEVEALVRSVTSRCEVD